MGDALYVKMMRAYGRGLAAHAFLLLFLLSAASLNSAGADQPGDNVNSRYRSSVFKVIAEGKVIGLPGGEFPMGTATLIHPAGYFITAAHIFDPAYNPDLGGKPFPLHQRVVLRSRAHAAAPVAVVEAELLFMGDSKRSDLAVLRAVGNFNWSSPHPDLFLGRGFDIKNKVVPLFLDTDAEIYGYPVKESILQKYAVAHLNPSDRDVEITFVAVPATSGSNASADLLQGGTSGALALAKNGVAWGVLHGDPRKIQAAGAAGISYVFTPSASVPDTWLEAMPFGVDAERLEKMLRRGTLNSDELLWLETSAKLTNIDLWKIVSAIAKERTSYPGLVGRANQELVKRCYVASLYTILTVAAPAPSLALDVARDLDRKSYQLRLAGDRTGGRAARLQGLQLYAAAEKSTGFKLGRLNQSVAYFDYGRAIEDAASNYPELKYSYQQAFDAYTAATASNPSYVSPYWRQAQLLAAASQFDSAIDYASIAKSVAVEPTAKAKIDADVALYMTMKKAPISGIVNTPIGAIRNPIPRIRIPRL